MKLLDSAVFVADFARPGRFKGEGKENSLKRLRTKGRIGFLFVLSCS